MTLETIAPFSEDPLVGGGVIVLSGGLAGFCQAATTGSRSYDMPWGTIVAGRAMKTARLMETRKSPWRHRELSLSPQLSSRRFSRLLR